MVKCGETPLANHTGTSKEFSPSSAVLQHTPAPPFPHPQFPSFSKSQLTTPAHDLVIPLPHRFYTLILWQ